MANNTDWLNISQMTGGTGETALSLTALTNSSLQPKTATITARNTQYNVSDTTTVTIQGFQPTLTLSRSTLRFDSTGGTATFTVYSNTAWTINFPALVHSYSTSAGTGDTEVTVVLAPNPDMVSKVEVGTVQDIFGVNQLYFTIVQESFIVELTVTPDDDIVFANTGSSTSVTIDCNADWEIEYPSWVTPSVTSGSSGTTTVTFSTGENGPTNRSGQITVYAGSKSVTINVYQPLYIPPYITVTPSAWTFAYSADGKTFIVDSYPEWTAEIVSSGDSTWASDAYVEAVFELPSAMTIQFLSGNSGSTTEVYVGPIRQYTNTYNAPSAGTYVIRYRITSGGTTPLLQNRQYLKEIKLSDKVGAIQNSCFSGCTALSSVTIGSGLTTIGAAAFSGCSALNEITITAPTAPSICANTFYGVATGGTLIYPVSSNYDTWLNPFDQYYLGYYGWPGFKGQTADIIATYEVTGSTTVPITSAVPSFSSYVKAVTYEDATVAEVDNNYCVTFPSTGEHKLRFFLKRDLPHSFFRQVEALTEIDMVGNLVVIGSNTFQGCTNLKTASFPNTVTDIGYTCFCGCTSLTSVTLSNNLTSIQSWSFGYCSALTSIVIPNSVTSIDYDAFAHCTSLSSITLSNSLTELGVLCFSDCKSLKNITLPDTLTSLPRSCFDGCSSLSAITIPNTMTGFGESCFSNCKSLTSIPMTQNISSLGKSCFYGCSGITDIWWPSSMSWLPDGCFQGCGITALTIPDTVTVLGQACFASCKKLRSIVIPSSIVELPKSCFWGCSSSFLTAITIPDSVNRIQDGCFRDCEGLTEVTFGNGLRYIGSQAFGSTELHTIICTGSAAPRIESDTFYNPTYYGTLKYPAGSNYSSWLSTSQYYLGYWRWTGQEI